MKVEIDKIKNVLVLALLFMAAMNFYAKFFYLAFASLIVLAFFQRKLLISPITFVYLGLGVVMSIYNHGEGIMSMIKCFAYVALYIVGYNMTIMKTSGTSNVICYDTKSAEKQGYALLMTVAGGSFAHYVANFIFNYSTNMGRNTNDIWTGEVMAATGQAAMACLMLGLAVAMIFAPPKKMYRVIGILSIVLILAYNLVLAGRTMLVMLVALIVVAIVYVRKAFTSSEEKFKLIIGFSVAIIAVAIVFAFNIGNLRDFVLSSNFFGRFGDSVETLTTDAARANRKFLYLRNSFKYPLGGLNMRNQFGYAHDLLLDGYDEYGIIGLILLVSVLAFGLRELYKLIRYTDYSVQFKLALLCVYIAALLEFCIEPILAGMPWLFVCFCLINGCITGMNVTYFQNKTEREF